MYTPGIYTYQKKQYLNFDQVPHLDPKSHGWSHILKQKPPKHIKRQYYSIQKKCQIYEKLGILGGFRQN